MFESTNLSRFYDMVISFLTIKFYFFIEDLLSTLDITVDNSSVNTTFEDITVLPSKCFGSNLATTINPSLCSSIQ